MCRNIQKGRKRKQDSETGRYEPETDESCGESCKVGERSLWNSDLLMRVFGFHFEWTCSDASHILDIPQFVIYTSPYDADNYPVL